ARPPGRLPDGRLGRGGARRVAGAAGPGLRRHVGRPLGDVEWRIPPIDGARVREDVRAWDAQGYDVAHTLALAPDGSPAGATALAVSRLRPAIGRQSDTGVLRDHRGLGLGR